MNCYKLLRHCFITGKSLLFKDITDFSKSTSDDKRKQLEFIKILTPITEGDHDKEESSKKELTQKFTFLQTKLNLKNTSLQQIEQNLMASVFMESDSQAKNIYDRNEDACIITSSILL